MLKRVNTNRGGIIRTVLFIVILLLILSYFGINLRDIVNSPSGQSNFSYVWSVLLAIWATIKGPVLLIWNAFLTLIWAPALHIIQSKTSSS